MRALVVVALLVAGAGCADNPCSGISGTCISGRVEGTVTGLDQLRVALDGVTQTQLSPTTPSPFSLPVRVAIALPSSATSPVTLTIDGLSGGQALATSGAQSVSFTAGGHASYTFTLTGGAVDDLAVGPTDLGGDMASVAVPGHVTLSPTTLSFPSTVRGMQSAPQIVTVYNRTGMTVSTVQPDMAGSTGGGGSGGGDFGPIGVTPASCVLGANGLTVPANVDCQLQMVFAPTASGMRTGSTPVAFSNGDAVTLSFSGQATPTWSGEGPGGSVQMLGVWATSGVAYAVGGVTSGMPWLSNMPGVWNPQGTFPYPWHAVTGVDTSHVWAGADGGIYELADGGGWASQTMVPNDAGAPGTINGVWAASATEAYAVSNAGQIYRYSGTSWSLIGQSPQSPLYAVSGANSGNYVVAGTMGYLAVPLAGVLSPVMTNTTVALHGVWEAATNNIFAVGDSSTIVHCTGSPLSCMVESSPVPQNLSAVSGRIDPATMMPDVWAVGALGNVVLHSNGGGTWTKVTVPNNMAMSGVFVLPSGEVFAVGGNGQVNHLY